MLDFNISGGGLEYFDLANTFLKVTASVVNANGDNLADDVEVAPVNNWLHALWSKIDLTLNGTSVSSSSHHYGYRAYMEAFANFGSDVKKGQLTAGFWHKDQAGCFDAFTNDDNTGYAARKALVAKS